MDINELLEFSFQQGASDLHLSAESAGDAYWW